jgi:hypothetical protein
MRTDNLIINILGVGLFGAVLAGGCGAQEGTMQTTGGTGGSDGAGGTGGSTVDPTITTGRYEPLAVGATWTYHVNDSGVTFDKITTVDAFEDIGDKKAGIMGYRVREQFPTEIQLTWYEVQGLVVVRHHEQALDTMGVMKSEDWYTPSRLRVDETPEHLVSGVSWTVSFADDHFSLNKPRSMTAKTDSIKVQGVDETVTVPAGTYKALHIIRVDTSDASTKNYWFVRGIGKVKEVTSGGHTEDLASFNIPQ